MTDRMDVTWLWGKGAFLVVLAAACVAALAIPAGAGAKANGPILFSDYTNIWKIQPDGSKLKKVAKRAAWSLDASPNGKTLIYTHDGLFKMSLSGGPSTNLLKRYPVVAKFAGVNWASWAPNAKRIVFSGQNDSRIYTIKPDGKGLDYLLGKKRTGLLHPVWSPNGKEIAYIDVSKGSSLMAVNVNTGKQRLIYPGDGPAGTPVDFDWHPSGKTIAFYAPYRNWMIDSDGSDLRQISPDSAFVSYENLDFSPDGKELLGRSVASGGTTSEIWNLNGTFGAASGGYAREVTTTFSGSAFFPEWAPRP